jgi:uncharacterized protein YbaR (Trm112 family)
MIDPQLLELLACPICLGDLRYEARDERLVCPACRLAFPIRDGIPILLREEALSLDAGPAPGGDPAR